MIPTRLRLLSANFEPGDNDAFAGKAAELVHAAGQTSPHMLAVQGLTQAQALKLSQMVEGASLVGGQRKWTPGARYGGLITIGDVARVSRSVDVPLGDDDSDVAVASVVTITVGDGGRPVILTSVNTHAQTQRRRLAEVGALIRTVEGAAPDRRAGRVIMGAFYERPDQAVYRILTGRRTHKGVTGDYRDSYRRVGRPESEGLSWAPPGDVPAMRADWILTAGVEIQEARVIQPVSKKDEGDGEGKRTWQSLHHAPIFTELLLS